MSVKVARLAVEQSAVRESYEERDLDRFVS
jgi:hypothetical protein